MLMNSIKFSVFALLINFISGCTHPQETKVYTEVQSGKAVIFDVREHAEIKEGMILGAVWIPLSELTSNPEATIKKIHQASQGREIYVYCRSGRRADVFIEKLKDHGLTGKNIGGYQELVSQGMPSHQP